MAEDHVRKSVGECHPCREFEGMQPSIYMKTSSASATGVSSWVSTGHYVARFLASGFMRVRDTQNRGICHSKRAITENYP
jgi:hypothetical protein